MFEISAFPGLAAAEFYSSVLSALARRVQTSNLWQRKFAAYLGNPKPQTRTPKLHTLKSKPKTPSQAKPQTLVTLATLVTLNRDICIYIYTHMCVFIHLVVCVCVHIYIHMYIYDTVYNLPELAWVASRRAIRCAPAAPCNRLTLWTAAG